MRGRLHAIRRVRSMPLRAAVATLALILSSGACSLVFPTSGYDLPGTDAAIDEVSPREGAAQETAMGDGPDTPDGGNDGNDSDADDAAPDRILPRTDAADPSFVCGANLACDPSVGNACCYAGLVSPGTLFNTDASCIAPATCPQGSLATCRDISDCVQGGAGSACCGIFENEDAGRIIRAQCLSFASCTGPSLRPICVPGGPPCDTGRTCVPSSNNPGFAFCE